MTVSDKEWSAYIRRLSALNEKAAAEMRDYVKKHGFSDMNAMIEYAYALATKYGEGAAAFSAAMYDAVAELSGQLLDPAVPAETASYSQVAKTVQGVAKTSRNPEEMGSAVGRLVKQAGADTTLQNALRDGAEFAWVPSGDTCAFCITLASRGWQRASRKAIKGGHAEHIHSNCDCTYAIRFDGKGGVAGYDPEKYLRMYENAEGDTWREKVNAMRRENYAEHKEEINAQKRAAYKARKDFLTESAERGIVKTDNRGMANGPRRGAFSEVTPQEQEHLLHCADELDIPRELLSFNTGTQTAFDDWLGIIHVRGDVFPSPFAENVDSILNERCALAHEYYGHFKHHPSEYDPGDWRDEFRASYRAAFDAPNLTNKERGLLIIDAYDRAREAGKSLQYTEEARRLLLDI